MRRQTISPRPDWPKTVELQGMLYHSTGGEPYWDEGAYYLFEAHEIDVVETATYRLNEMCLKAVEHVLEHERFEDFDIPPQFGPWLRQSWEVDEHTIYGRFDLSYDGNGLPKLLEYNADTPTALLEAAVIQWYWMQDVLARSTVRNREQFDQFNSLHEHLIEAWQAVRRDLGPVVYFSVLRTNLEDVMTVTYLRDTAAQAGLRTELIGVRDIGWHAGRHVFTDLQERPIPTLFKLYPWEWLIRETFGRNLPAAPTHWLEAPWKMILSNKAILTVLYELFPDSPYLLRAGFEPIGDTYVVKPTLAREGANVAIVDGGRSIAQTDGAYSGGRCVYQDYAPLPNHDGRYPVVGSWMVNGYACGLGIREDSGPITRNTSRFVPHLFRKSPHAAPLE